MKRRWRVWLLDNLMFRYGITIECSEDEAMDFTQVLGELGCKVESCHPWDEL
jgi:hypothetical protein